MRQATAMTGFLKGRNFRILILSVWMLFLELFLVRWISTEIRIFAYVNNLVLLACFIGVGLGCYFAEKKTYPLSSLGLLAVLIVSVKSIPFIKITELLSGFSDSVIWYQAIRPDNFFPAIAGTILTVFMFGIIATVFFPIGQLLGTLFNGHDKPIIAYSLNIFGNIIGIWLFSAISFLSLSPWVWYFIALFLSIPFFQKSTKELFFIVMAALFSFIMLFIPAENSLFTIWSPYQKLSVNENRFDGIMHGYMLDVNNVGYMSLQNISRDFFEKNYGNNQPNNQLLYTGYCFNQYEIPYMLKKGAENVLIVGSGGGNDVAGALRQGIKHIDAVEIDPVIYKIGYLLHPERPYKDKRVNIHIDDARSFFKKTRKTYDVVAFGLLDAHTTSSSYNNIRLDHYVYTLESFKEAKRLLKPDGIMTIVFMAKRDWIAYRIYNLLTGVFGSAPLTFRIGTPSGIFGFGGTMYVAAANPGEISKALAVDPALKSFIDANRIISEKKDVKITTDDWPYLYLERPALPKMFLCIIISLIIIFAIGTRTLFTQKERLNLHFFFLGAAFLLLEFQNISKSSLLFGSTWLVNAYMITAILILILLANLFAARFKPLNIKVFYYLLWLSVLCIFIAPLGSMNVSGSFLRAMAVSIFMNIPVFFAGVIFIHSFSSTPRKDIALGSNIFGACVGGLFESLSFVFGIKALLILVLAFYVLSCLTMRKKIGVNTVAG
jgi:SAM-dependent methyltransferase